MRTAMRKALGLGLATAMAMGIAATATTDADAAETVVSSTGKGIAGGALLGGEVGFLTLSVAGARSGWLYATIPAALAIGGGIGGHYIEKGVSSAEVPMYMLAGGMALVIPTIVVTLTATATPYTSADTSTTDTGVSPSPSPAAAPGAPSAAGPSARHIAPVRPTARSFALVNFDDTTAPRLSLPAVEIAPMYSNVELSKFGGTQRWQYNAPLVAVTF